MSDEVRDMALTAKLQAESAHRRIDGYNGQIRRVGDEVASLRTDVGKDLLDIKLELGGIKTRTAGWAAIFAVVGSGLVTAIFGLVLFLAKDRLIDQPERGAAPPAIVAPAQEPQSARKAPGGANIRSGAPGARASRTTPHAPRREAPADRRSAPAPAPPSPPDPEEDEEPEGLLDLVDAVLTAPTGTLPLP